MTSPDKATEKAPDLPEFDAFFSYASNPDATLVRRVERYVEGFHKQWLAGHGKLRPLSVFVDGSDMRARTGTSGHGIRETLEVHLRQSRRLVVFCSRGAARSEYVADELRWWLQHRGIETLMCVVTEPFDTVSEVFPTPAVEAGLHEALWFNLTGAAWWRRAKGRTYAAERLQLAAWLHHYEGIPAVGAGGNVLSFGRFQNAEGFGGGRRA